MLQAVAEPEVPEEAMLFLKHLPLQEHITGKHPQV
jgi:hypothetical protein